MRAKDPREGEESAKNGGPKIRRDELLTDNHHERQS